ncbi:hypothetical protein VTK26DRAFT_9035 [Humicola hyalothermophila]
MTRLPSLVLHPQLSLSAERLEVSIKNRHRTRPSPEAKQSTSTWYTERLSVVDTSHSRTTRFLPRNLQHRHNTPSVQFTDRETSFQINPRYSKLQPGHTLHQKRCELHRSVKNHAITVPGSVGEHVRRWRSPANRRPHPWLSLVGLAFNSVIPVTNIHWRRRAAPLSRTRHGQQRPQPAPQLFFYLEVQPAAVCRVRCQRSFDEF